METKIKQEIRKCFLQNKKDWFVDYFEQGAVQFISKKEYEKIIKENSFNKEMLRYLEIKVENENSNFIYSWNNFVYGSINKSSWFWKVLGIISKKEIIFFKFKNENFERLLNESFDNFNKFLNLYFEKKYFWKEIFKEYFLKNYLCSNYQIMNFWEILNDFKLWQKALDNWKKDFLEIYKKEALELLWK